MASFAKARVVGWVALVLLGATPVGAEGGAQWPHYGGDLGGMRYTSAGQITPANVEQLEVAWSVHTGDVSDGEPPFESTSAFELTPILVDGTLYACTVFDRVLALDPATGTERWSYDPGIDKTGDYANQFVCRGVAFWSGAASSSGADDALGGDDSKGAAASAAAATAGGSAPRAACAQRIFLGTLDARLVALDAATGKPCPGFGGGGQVQLLEGVGETMWLGEYSLTSPPLIAGDLVIVGSAVADNVRTGAPSGVVRAFDARSGMLRWAWDVAPEDLEPARREPSSGYGLSTPNVWAPMSYDAERDLVFVPTGNPTPDYASGHRRGLDTYGSSLVALHGATGKVAWYFQTVHHDVWDFDVPAQPTLFPLRRNGAQVPAVVQATKMGLLFTFERATGTPLFPIEERPVPQGGEPGFVLSPTQPFPLKPPPLVRHTFEPDDAWGGVYFDRRACRKRVEELRFDGIYTPPTKQGTLMYPGNGGGSNWGGVAVDPERQLLFANVMDVPWVVTLFDRDDFERAREAAPGVEHGRQQGTPYGMRREMLISPLGVPCNAPPWGQLHAIDLATGEIAWSTPFGTPRDMIPLPVSYEIGMPGIGGPLATASGLVFIGAAVDNYFRAFDAKSGELLWRARLPASPQATPMSYEHGGRQYVVIAAGGHGRAGTPLGDEIVAFALPAGGN